MWNLLALLGTVLAIFFSFALSAGLVVGAVQALFHGLLMVYGEDTEGTVESSTLRRGKRRRSPPEYHLRGNFERDRDGTLCWGAKTYIEKVMKSYERMFGELPKKSSCQWIRMTVLS